MPLAQLNGIQLYYQVSGCPDARTPAVILLHGLGSSAADWALQIPAFAKRYRVISLDLRGHGRSSGADRRFTVESMADDVADLLTDLGEPPAHVVGLSLGGCVALALALRHPGCVRSLTLVNTFAKYQPVGLRGAWRAVKRLWLLWTAPMPVVAVYVARGLFPKPDQREFYHAAVASLSQNSKRACWASLRAVQTFDVQNRLGAIACPTLIVAGDRDATVPLSAKEALRRCILGSRLLVVSDSGHATPYDQAEFFNRAVLEFVAAH